MEYFALPLELVHYEVPACTLYLSVRSTRANENITSGYRYLMSNEYEVLGTTSNYLGNCIARSHQGNADHGMKMGGR